VPACAQACPTQSIQFGPIKDLKVRATARVEQLHRLGESRARLYGADEEMLGGLNSFYLLVDEPEVYGLPRAPKLPSRNLFKSSFFSVVGAAIVVLAGLVGLRQRRMEDRVREEGRPDV
jgi:formate dehydrogenase iron-sulfur subunit